MVEGEETTTNPHYYPSIPSPRPSQDSSSSLRGLRISDEPHPSKSPHLLATLKLEQDAPPIPTKTLHIPVDIGTYSPSSPVPSSYYNQATAGPSVSKNTLFVTLPTLGLDLD